MNMFFLNFILTVILLFMAFSLIMVYDNVTRIHRAVDRMESSVEFIEQLQREKYIKSMQQPNRYSRSIEAK